MPLLTWSPLLTRSPLRTTLTVVAVTATVLLGVPASAVAADGTCGGRAATVVGTDAAQTLTGTPGDDVISAGAGADSIDGLGGDDVICPGVGDDVVDGGDGTDEVVLPGTAPTRASLLTGVATNRTGGTDTLAGVENLTGGAGPDVLTGDGGPNVLRGHGGADTIDAGAGEDVCIPGAGPDALTACDSGRVVVLAGQKDTFTYDLPITQYLLLDETAYRASAGGAIRWSMTTPRGDRTVAARRADVDHVVKPRWLQPGPHTLTVEGSTPTTTGYLEFTLYAPPSVLPDVIPGTSLATATPVRVTTTLPQQNVEVPVQVSEEMILAELRLSVSLTDVTWPHPDDVDIMIKYGIDEFHFRGPGTYAMPRKFRLGTAHEWLVRVDPAGDDVGSATLAVAVSQPKAFAVPDVPATLADAVPVEVANDEPGQDVELTFRAPQEWTEQRRQLVVVVEGGTWGPGSALRATRGSGIGKGFGRANLSDSGAGVLVTLFRGAGTVRVRLTTNAAVGHARVRVAAVPPATIPVPVLDSLRVARSTHVETEVGEDLTVTFVITPQMVAERRVVAFRLSDVSGWSPDRANAGVHRPDGSLAGYGPAVDSTIRTGRATQAGTWTLQFTGTGVGAADVRVAALPAGG